MVLSLGWFIRVLCDEMIKENPKKISNSFFSSLSQKKRTKKKLLCKKEHFGKNITNMKIK
jgi:hypothetical protein